MLAGVVAAMYDTIKFIWYTLERIRIFQDPSWMAARSMNYLKSSFFVADGVVVRNMYMLKQKKYDPRTGKKSWEKATIIHCRPNFPRRQSGPEERPNPALMRSLRMSEFETEPIKELLREAFNRFAPRKSDAEARDFVFHMTDWLDDLAALADLFSNPATYAPREATGIVARFLYHAPNHVLPAARLLLDYEPPKLPLPSERGAESQ